MKSEEPDIKLKQASRRDRTLTETSKNDLSTVSCGLPNSASTDMWLRFPSDQLLQRLGSLPMPRPSWPLRLALAATAVARTETEQSTVGKLGVQIEKYLFKNWC